MVGGFKFFGFNGFVGKWICECNGFLGWFSFSYCEFLGFGRFVLFMASKEDGESSGFLPIKKKRVPFCFPLLFGFVT